MAMVGIDIKVSTKIIDCESNENIPCCLQDFHAWPQADFLIDNNLCKSHESVCVNTNKQLHQTKHSLTIVNAFYLEA